MFKTLRTKIADLIAPPKPTRVRTVKPPKAVAVRPPISMARMYAAAKASRLTTGWGTSTTSEDTELHTSLGTLRNRSRQLIRDSAYAKRAKVIVQNNVVGAGIGLQAKLMTTRATMHTRLNDEIEAVWERWCCGEYCHTGGSLHFGDLERMAMGQVFEAGEIFLRLHRRAQEDSPVPLALELIEPERIADEFQPLPLPGNSRVRLGIEQDEFSRPLAYWIRSRHPGEVRVSPVQTEKVERVPASDMLHLRLIDRWPQTRGVPWLHAVARRLNDMDGLGEAEIVAARAAACYMGFIESPSGETQYGEPQADGSKIAELEPGQIEHLAHGEKFTYAAPNRPNAQLDPFMRLMLREVAAGVGCSYESLSRDYSQSNYSSSRLSLLDDRDLWRMLQMWFIRTLRVPLHKVWLQQAVMAKALDTIPIMEYALAPEKYEAARFKPRGWSWVDPTKEVEASILAIKAGFTTVGQVIAQTGEGRDLEDVLNERKQETELMAQMGLKFDSDPSFVNPADKPVPPAAPQKQMDDGDNPSVEEAERMLRVLPHTLRMKGAPHG